VSRSAGRSVVASAAYRAGETLTNDRDGMTHDYARRRGVVSSSIIAPAGCDWANDRSTLWNAAEAIEKRKDAKVGREYIIALPHEIDGPAREALAHQFARSIVERFGVAADVAIHAPGEEGDQRNHHAHILTTTRVVGPDGLGAKTRQLDTSATASKEVESLRELWGQQANAALERAGEAATLDHRSYERQQIERVPGVHLGPMATKMERREKKAAAREGREYQPRTHAGRKNAEAAKKNQIIEAARKVMEVAEKAMTEARNAVSGVMDWLEGVAAELGKQANAKDQKAAQELEKRREQQAVKQMAPERPTVDNQPTIRRGRGR